MDDRGRAAANANWTRYRAGQQGGHYESFFQRANHPSRPLAFWIRYTLFSPEGRPADAIGELWAIFFDGETGEHVAVKREVPIGACRFDRGTFSVAVDDATLDPRKLRGSASSAGHVIEWDLAFEGTEAPLFLLPRGLYDAKLPRAKSLVALPLARYRGSLRVDGRAIDIDDWIGSQNHNWGSRHTDEYAWGQVAGFDSEPDTFLEVATARLKLGPLRTPRMTLVVLRRCGVEFRLNGLLQSVRATGFQRDFDWKFASGDERIGVEGSMTAPPNAFVGLRYWNPPGGEKHCLNTKIARCVLRVTDRRTGAVATLMSANRAAFEILTDRRDHGVAIRA